ncbi:MAG: YheC/YheD family protein [Bacillota bacterium]|nr:YheC/YheD family protein [Bacillota bacterium]
MWIKINIIISDKKIITIPNNNANFLNNKALLIFGKKIDYAEVVLFENITNINKHTFNNPINIQITSKLADSLLINENIIYKLVYNQSIIKIGPVIGFLLGNKTHLYTPEYMNKYSDRFGIYNSIGGLVYGFSPESINWNNNSTEGLFYNHETKKWVYGIFPLPEVIYRRNFHTDSNIIDMLINITNDKLFNSYRFTKYEMFTYIQKNKNLKRCLPDTALLKNFNTIHNFLVKYSKVIIKPVNLSRGIGIQVIEKINNSFTIHDYSHKVPADIYINNLNSLENYYMKNNNFFQNFLIQQCLDLAKFQSSIFDIRIVMQKDENLNWKCSGIECRIAKIPFLITNISKGGHAVSLDDVLKDAFPERTDYDDIKKSITTLCKDLCTSLDKMGHHFAEFGIDVGIDAAGKLWLIEVNVFPSFKGFKSMNYDEYIDIRETPLKYALSLTDFGGTESNVNQ